MKMNDVWVHMCKACAETLPMHPPAVGGLLYPPKECECCGKTLTLENFHPVHPMLAKQAIEARAKMLEGLVVEAQSHDHINCEGHDHD